MFSSTFHLSSGLFGTLGMRESSISNVVNGVFSIQLIVGSFGRIEMILSLIMLVAIVMILFSQRSLRQSL